MDPISSIALASGLSWASGFRLYATVFIIGLIGKYNFISLPDGLDILTNPIVIGVAGILMLIEFLADKVPYIDSTWDSIQTFIRIPAGALLAMGAINSSDPMIATLAALLGGSLTGVTHATKAGSRALINTSPEPVSNITTSFAEDGLFLTGGWLALMHPFVFIGFLLLIILVMIWMLPKVWRGVRSIFSVLEKPSETSQESSEE
ncbi:MAG: DUF4126 domain-containing protein [Methylophilaceae bacterium]